MVHKFATILKPHKLNSTLFNVLVTFFNSFSVNKIETYSCK